MKIWKIIIAITLLFLIVGIATAAVTDVDYLKAPTGFEDFLAGMSQKTDNNNMYITIEEMEFNKDAFKNANGINVERIDENFYKFVDANGSFCGAQEKVKINGVEYLVYVEDDSTSDGDFNSYVELLKEFNKLNNLKPIEV